MNITVHALEMTGILVLAMGVGYMIGRVFEGVKQRTSAGGKNGCSEIAPEGRNRNGEKKITAGKVIASPVAGRVDLFVENEEKGVVIFPEEGNIYAPVSGKITKLYPMGNAFLIRMEDRTEIRVQVGTQLDELCAEYFHPRVIQNEIVNKGKLLLVFDREYLLTAGENISVTVSIEENLNGREAFVTQEGHMKVGDVLMEIVEKIC